MKKILFFLLITVFVISCENEKKEGGAVELKMFTRWPDDGAAFGNIINDRIEEFNKLYEGKIFIDYEAVAVEAQYLEKLRTSFASGNAPHIFLEYGGSRLVDYIEANTLLDLKPYLDADPVWKAQFRNGAFDKWEYQEYPGIWGFPVISYAVLLYYNKEIFEKYNLKAPETWDELDEVCRVLMDNGVQPFLLGEKDVWRAGHIHNNIVIKSLGIDAVDRLADRTLAYDSPEMIKTYAKLKDFVDKGYFGENAVGVDNNFEYTAFIEGQSAMMFNGTWMAELILSYNSNFIDKVAAVPFPTIVDEFNGAFQGGPVDGVSITSYSEAENDAAVEFLKFLLSQDFYRELEYKHANVIFPVVIEESDERLVDSELTKSMKESVSVATDFRDDVQTYDTDSHMIDTVRNAIQGLFIGRTPEEVGKEITDRIEDYQ